MPFPQDREVIMDDPLQHTNVILLEIEGGKIVKALEANFPHFRT